MVQKLSLFVATQTKTTEIFWQVPQWALDMATFDFTRDVCHRRLWCLNRHNFNWSCFILWMMDLSLSDSPLHRFEALLACYLCLSLVKTQYFKQSPSIKLAWKICKRWEEEKTTVFPLEIKLEIALQFCISHLKDNLSKYIPHKDQCSFICVAPLVHSTPCRLIQAKKVIPL